MGQKCIFFLFFYSRSAPSSPNQVGISGLMTPESLSREGSPGPEGIHLHAAPHPNGHGVVHMSSDSPAQVVASHMEVKTNHFPPGVPNILTGAQSKLIMFLPFSTVFCHFSDLLSKSGIANFETTSFMDGS